MDNQQSPEHNIAELLNQVADAIKPPAGRVIDVLGETAENAGDDLLQSADLPIPTIRRQRFPRRTDASLTAGQLPPECHGIGCLSRQMLIDLLTRCAGDRACLANLAGGTQRQE